MTTEFFPELTLRYKTYVKNSLVDALNHVFAGHPDELLQRTRASGEFSRVEIDYPRVLVRFYEREIFNAGVGHLETIHFQGESDSVEVSAEVPPAGGSVHLSWPPVEGATGYWVYKDSEAFFVGEPAYDDDGTLGTPKAVPTEVTSTLRTPHPIAVVGALGGLRGGTYTYRVTALAGLQAVKFGHYFYSADIELEVSALSSLDRDYIADTLVETIAMGRLQTYTDQFYDRIYPTQDLYPDSYWNFIGINSDKIQGFGETQNQVPWGAEDDLLYQVSYRVGVFGEFYSLPPKLTWSLVQKITQYPYIGGREPVPTGDPNSDAPWVSNGMGD